MLLGEGMRLDRPYRVQNEGDHAAVNFGEAQKQADRSSNSRSSYVPSMTPIMVSPKPKRALAINGMPARKEKKTATPMHRVMT